MYSSLSALTSVAGAEGQSERHVAAVQPVRKGQKRRAGAGNHVTPLAALIFGCSTYSLTSALNVNFLRWTIIIPLSHLPILLSLDTYIHTWLNSIVNLFKKQKTKKRFVYFFCRQHVCSQNGWITRQFQHCSYQRMKTDAFGGPDVRCQMNEKVRIWLSRKPLLKQIPVSQRRNGS